MKEQWNIKKALQRTLSFVLMVAILGSMQGIAGFSQNITVMAAETEGNNVTPQKPVCIDGVYQISNVGELYWFAGLVNGTLIDGTEQKVDANAIITNDIVLNQNVMSVDNTLNDGTFIEWLPIGDYLSNEKNVFCGTFDGGGHIIRGLYINTRYTPYGNYPSGKKYQGLFGYSKGIIKDIDVVDSYIYAGDKSGIVCGYNEGNIINVKSRGSIEGQDVSACYVGSVCGYNTGTLENITSVSDTVGKAKYRSGFCYTGGICGKNEGLLNNCTYSGKIEANAEGDGNSTKYDAYCYVGGISGDNEGEVTNCNHIGTLIGDSWCRYYAYCYTGGVSGINSGKIKSCSSRGNISGSASGYSSAPCGVGGISGRSNNGTIDGCYNHGTLKGSSSKEDYVGGICGYNYSSIIKNSYNKGDVRGYFYIGGICGENQAFTSDSVIMDCYNKGQIHGGSNFSSYGGICGINYAGGRKCEGDAIIRNCYNIGHLSSDYEGEMEFGGICGTNQIYSNEIHTSIVKDSYYLEGIATAPIAHNVEYGEHWNAEYSDVIEKSAMDFSDGSVCSLLNATSISKSWTQNIGIDSFPSLMGNEEKDGLLVTTISVEYESNGFINEKKTIIGALELSDEDEISSDILSSEVVAIKWTSSDQSIVPDSEISCTGVNSYDNRSAELLISFTPHKEGKVTITGTTSNGLMASCEVTVSDNNAKVDTFSITKKVSKKLRDKFELTAHLVLTATGNTSETIITNYVNDISWNISDSSIAVVKSITTDLSDDYREATLKIVLTPKAVGKITLAAIVKGGKNGDIVKESAINIYSNGYVAELDGWSIGNYARNFGDDNYTFSPLAFYGTYGLTSPITSNMTALVALKNKMNKKFDGNCFGLSVLSSANYSEKINLQKYFDNNGDYLAEYGYQSNIGGRYFTLKDNSSAVTLLERTQASQYSLEFKKTEVFNSNYSQLIAYLNGDNANPIVTTLEGTMTQNGNTSHAAHAILIDPSEKPIELSGDGSGDIWYMIKLYDPNTPSGVDNLTNPTADYNWESFLYLNIDTGAWKYIIYQMEGGEHTSEVARIENVKNSFMHEYIKFYDASKLSDLFFDIYTPLTSVEMISFIDFGDNINIEKDGENIFTMADGKITTLKDDYDYETYFGDMLSSDIWHYIGLDANNISYTSPYAAYSTSSKNSTYFVLTVGESAVNIDKSQDKLNIVANEDVNCQIGITTETAKESTIDVATNLERGNSVSLIVKENKLEVNSLKTIELSITYPTENGENVNKTISVTGEKTIDLNDSANDNGTSSDGGSTDTPSAPSGGSTDTPSGGGTGIPSGGSTDTPSGGSTGTPSGGNTDTPSGDDKGNTDSKLTAKKMSLSKASYVYNGKAKKPAVTVIDNKGNKISSAYYTVSYRNNKKVGKGTVTVTLKNGYSGTLKKDFTIKPKGTKLTSVTGKSKSISIKWAKQKTQTTGYQIQYSTSSKFSKKATVTKTVKKNATTKLTAKKLKAKKIYYVRIRTYKTVNGKKYYSAWSKVKEVKTKK